MAWFLEGRGCGCSDDTVGDDGPLCVCRPTPDRKAELHRRGHLERFSTQTKPDHQTKYQAINCSLDSHAGLTDSTTLPYEEW